MNKVLLKAIMLQSRIKIFYLKNETEIGIIIKK